MRPNAWILSCLGAERIAINPPKLEPTEQIVKEETADAESKPAPAKKGAKKAAKKAAEPAKPETGTAAEKPAEREPEGPGPAVEPESLEPGAVEPDQDGSGEVLDAEATEPKEPEGQGDPQNWMDV